MLAVLVLRAVQSATVSTGQAEQLAAGYVKTHPHMGYWAPKPKLVEITTKEIADQLHAQVFKHKGYTVSITEPEAYLVKDGKIYPLSVGSGGYGLTSMCVSTLGRNHVPALCYTYSWGSGIHRSHLEAMLFDGKQPRTVAAPFVIRDIDLKLSISSDGGVRVYAVSSPDGSPVVLLGKLNLTKTAQRESLDLAFEPDLAKHWRDLIWLSYAHGTLADNLAGSYEVNTASIRGMFYYMGDVELRAKGAYRYTESESNSEERWTIASSFFVRHPKGRYSIQYSRGISGTTLLEKLPDQADLCVLTFQPAGRRSGQRLQVMVTLEARSLRCKMVGRQSFTLGH
ncbi:MAG: hypothetical protein ACHQ50_01555 [Fimbriimonadales bacterium]